MSAAVPHKTTELLLKALQWRYAVQKFDPNKRVPDDTWETLEQSLVLAPSSFGLQPWKFFVVTSQMIKDKMVAASWNQRQVADASHVVVMGARLSLDLTDVERHLRRTAEVRNVPVESLARFEAALSRFVQSPPKDFALDVWAAKQVYIALGQFLVSAAIVGVDTCPMEGFDPVKIDELLGLTSKGYTAVALVPAGYRSSDDSKSNTPKVRFKHDEVIERLS